MLANDLETRPWSAAVVATALLSGAVLLFAPSRAEPCTPAPCTGGSFSLDEADVPANLQSFLWEPRVDRRTDNDGPLEELDVVVRDLETDQPVGLSAQRVRRDAVHIELDEKLVPERRYRFVAENDCERANDTYQSTFLGAPEAGRPTSIPRPAADSLEIGDETIVAFGGSCGRPSRDLEAGIRRVRTRITREMQPWTDVWETTAQIRRDGADRFRDWSAPSTIQRPSADREGFLETTLVTACEQPDQGVVVSSLEPGRYEVRFRASLPATEWSIDSDSVTVPLRCSKTHPDDVGPDHDVGPPDDVDPDSDVGPDSGPDRSDTGGGLGWSQRHGSDSGSGGCAGCSSSGSSPLSPALVVFAVLGWVIRRGRDAIGSSTIAGPDPSCCRGRR